jgi:hypothetical protein
MARRPAAQARGRSAGARLPRGQAAADEKRAMTAIEIPLAMMFPK